MLSVVHDLAEAHVGDITPYEGVTREQKRQLEAVRLFKPTHQLPITIVYLTRMQWKTSVSRCYMRG